MYVAPRAKAASRPTGAAPPQPTLSGIHYIGVQWEGGAVDWGSRI